ncbi:MAG TPA: PQQ-dependent sugar dehydrogenase [Gammaproteobacteria bacterium]|nr:PQQ-dependent sugar dehydrogenase [Gammaproteobacteria bacterium]
MHWTTKLAGAGALALAALPAAAQQTVRFNPNSGFPVAPSGIQVPPLPDKPVTYHTAEGQDIRVRVFTRGLKQPWSLAFLPDGNMLVTERGGQLRLVHADGTLEPQPIAGVPAVRAQGLSGLMEVALHPQFATNRWIYLTYTKPLPDNTAVLALARGVWNGKALTQVKDLLVTGKGTGEAARLAFGRDGLLYMTSGGDDDTTQDPTTHAGKVLRLKDDGTAAPGNPFAGKGGNSAEVWTLGHRNGMALVFRPGTDELWEAENGPNGGDEVNVLVAGGNYGWPLVSLGRTYPGPWQSKGFYREGMIDPVVYWTPAIAISGLAFYTGDKLPKWKGNMFVGGLRQGEIPGTGHLERVLFNDKMEELRREQLLVDLRQRIRDVRQGPDELLYLLTGEDTGAILRIEPAN